MTRHGRHPDPNALWWQKSPTLGVVVAWSAILASAVLVVSLG